MGDDEQLDRQDVAAQLWAALSLEERQSFIAGSYTEEKATEWLARVGQSPVPAGLYEAFDTRSHWDAIASTMVQIRLREVAELSRDPDVPGDH